LSHNPLRAHGGRFPRGHKTYVPRGWDDKRAQEFMDTALARFGGNGASCTYLPGQCFRFKGFFSPGHRVVDVPVSVSPNRAMIAFSELLTDLPLEGCPQVWAPGPS